MLNFTWLPILDTVEIETSNLSYNYSLIIILKVRYDSIGVFELPLQAPILLKIGNFLMIHQMLPPLVVNHARKLIYLYVQKFRGGRGLYLHPVYFRQLQPSDIKKDLDIGYRFSSARLYIKNSSE